MTGNSIFEDKGTSLPFNPYGQINREVFSHFDLWIFLDYPNNLIYVIEKNL